MIPPQHTLLWAKIQQFQFDDPTVTLPFSAKLAANQQWSPSFTQQAIEEYRKFLFLCCVLENGAAPSKTVDEVWHLHLTYTRNYWTDLCRDTLEKEIHHYPSGGGAVENVRHRQWYLDTLQSYRQLFDTEPPSAIWPTAKEETTLPAIPPFRWNSGPGLLITVIALLPFAFIALIYHTLNPFSLGGPHFLNFFPVFSLSMILCYLLYRLQVSRQLSPILSPLFDQGASLLQITAACYGKNRALQAAIFDLVNRRLLEPDDNRFIVHKENYTPMAEDTNPLIPAFENEPDGSSHTYPDLMGNWYDRDKFSHPSLDIMNNWMRQQEPFLPTYLFQLLFLTMAVSRIVQGSLNDRPIWGLINETVLFTIAFVLATVSLTWRRLVSNNIRRLFTKRMQSWDGQNYGTVAKYALQGTSAIQGMAFGVALTGIFSAYTPSTADNSGMVLTDWSSDNSASDSGGSSCSSGSSCGSSCGGCSGGN